MRMTFDTAKRQQNLSRYTVFENSLIGASGPSCIILVHSPPPETKLWNEEKKGLRRGDGRLRIAEPNKMRTILVQ